ncbi:EFR1 family ferrodoxin [Gordonibacter sp. An230]|uniref:EFR1 family ferrodoxin n=1 Tax=Gordonibacter sp. An230 TaxID=1965592 RepID=UPI0013A63C0B|nr:EFR1 family ferrodoxin [Gordonibacter sp. An230]
MARTREDTMIFYYSATGNSRHAAKRLAAALDDTAVSVLDCRAESRTSFALPAGEPLGLVTPTYFMGLPTLMSDFLDALELDVEGEPYVYLVATFGNFSGTTRAMTAKALKRHGIRLAAAFGVRMVDTWTPWFDVSDRERALRITREADTRIDDIAARIRRREEGSYRLRTGPLLEARAIHALWRRGRSTAPFSVSDACIGCGRCARECPSDAIRMSEGMPVWASSTCAQCLGCLHRCPVFAIQRGPRTKRHGQWTHPGERVG